jgi:hypothetical protein
VADHRSVAHCHRGHRGDRVGLQLAIHATGRRQSAAGPICPNRPNPQLSQDILSTGMRGRRGQFPAPETQGPASVDHSPDAGDVREWRPYRGFVVALYGGKTPADDRQYQSACESTSAAGAARILAEAESCRQLQARNPHASAAQLLHDPLGEIVSPVIGNS